MLKVQGTAPAQRNISRKQWRWLKRGQKTNAYYHGLHADPEKLAGPYKAIAAAARDKRARKADKRLRDAGNQAVSDLIAREAIVSPSLSYKPVAL